MKKFLNSIIKTSALSLTLPVFVFSAQAVDNTSGDIKAESQVELTKSEIKKVNAQTKLVKRVDTKAKLQAKLAKFDGFTANFAQSVYTEEGELLQQGSGLLKVKKPHYLYWEMQEPEENLIVCDGKALWVYNPFIEQVSVYSLDSSASNTPMLLLSNSDGESWQHYNVTQDANGQFVVKAKSENSQVAQLNLSFSGDSISTFSVIDATGQKSVFSLSNVSHKNLPDLSLFNFIVPEGVDIDDQR